MATAAREAGDGAARAFSDVHPFLGAPLSPVNADGEPPSPSRRSARAVWWPRGGDGGMGSSTLGRRRLSYILHREKTTKGEECETRTAPAHRSCRGWKAATCAAAQPAAPPAATATPTSSRWPRPRRPSCGSSSSSGGQAAGFPGPWPQQTGRRARRSAAPPPPPRWRSAAAPRSARAGWRRHPARTRRTAARRERPGCCGTGRRRSAGSSGSRYGTSRGRPARRRGRGSAGASRGRRRRRRPRPTDRLRCRRRRQPPTGASGSAGHEPRPLTAHSAGTRIL